MCVLSIVPRLRFWMVGRPKTGLSTPNAVMLSVTTDMYRPKSVPQLLCNLHQFLSFVTFLKKKVTF